MAAQGKCERCGALFSRTVDAKRFCGERCRKAAETARADARALEVNLARCGKCHEVKPWGEFSPSMRTNGGYCKPCNREYQRFRQREKLRPCRRCGVEFARWDDYAHPGSAATHCNPCYLAVSREKYAARIAREEQRAVELREARNRKNARRKIPKPHEPLAGSVWERVRKQVIAEESDCHICGKPVDKSLRWPHPESPSADHVIPRAQGGQPYERSNLRLAHLSCNAAAGARWIFRRRWQPPLVDLAFIA